MLVEENIDWFTVFTVRCSRIPNPPFIFLSSSGTFTAGWAKKKKEFSKRLNPSTIDCHHTFSPTETYRENWHELFWKGLAVIRWHFGSPAPITMNSEHVDQRSMVPPVLTVTMPDVYCILSLEDQDDEIIVEKLIVHIRVNHKHGVSCCLGYSPFLSLGRQTLS